MRVRELMTQPVVTCPIASTLDHAARLMWEYDCGIIPVVGDTGRLEGVITDRDICIAAYTQGRPLHELPVTTAMSRNVVAAHPQDAIGSAETLMREHQVRRLPVVDQEGRPIGMLSMNDLTRAAARSRRTAAEHEVVATMAAICQPRRTVGHGERPPIAAVAG